MIRILIVDDSAVVCRGLKQILSGEGDISVVGEASNAGEMLGLVREKPCDVVVMDVSMPDRSGLDALQELKREQPKLPILIMSVYPEDRFGVQALKLGASGYVSKESAAEELVEAIQQVVTGKRYVSPSLAGELTVDVSTGPRRPPHETLSQRERQILSLLASGKSISEIADGLGVGAKTISTYRSRILEKMHMRSTAELIRYATQHQLDH